MRRLCPLQELAIGTSRGFAPSLGGFTGLFAVRSEAGVEVYVNACPHIGVALDGASGDFLTCDRVNIVCATHGALFEPSTGRCIEGPCQGDFLERVELTLEEGWLLVPDDAGL